MSEYQYYEFLAIDRPLNAAQIKAVRQFSTRATITATSFINEYNYGGGFRGDEEHFLSKYFDAMVYVTNWGTHQFMFNVPRNLIDVSAVEVYCTERSFNAKPKGDHLLLDLCRDEEDGGDWEDGRGHMASLAGLRAEVISGDLRPLYLAWLAGLEMGDIDPEIPAPPIPPGLRKLTASQKSLVDFLGIDNQLVRMVAADSDETAASPAFDIDTALARVPVADKDQWLKELIESDDPHAGLRIKLKLQGAVLPRPATVHHGSQTTAGELFERYQKHTRELDEQLRLANEARRRKEQAAAAALREKHLDQLARNIPGAWRNLEQMIGLKNQEGYQQAVEVLIDLRDLSNRPGGDSAAFRRELAQRLAEHGRKGAFIRMVQKAGLT